MRKLVWKNSLGDEINLTKAPFGIINWEGFSNAPLNIQSQQVPMQDGSVFLDALIENRDLNVTLSIQDGNDLEKRYELERQLIHILNPKLGEGYLIYTNDFISKRIKCIPQIPLFPNKNSNEPGTQKGELAWTACEPYWEDLEEKQMFFSVGETPTITNDGDVPAQIKIEFFGTSEKSEIRNLTTKQKIEINTSIGDGVVANTVNGEKKISKYNIDFNVVNIINSYYGMTYSNKANLFVAVGSDGETITSNDGLSWVYRSSGFLDFLMAVSCSENLHLFIAVGNSYLIISSTDGITWTERYSEESGVNKYFEDVTYSQELGLFVAVGTNGKIMTSADGIDWTSRSSGSPADNFAVTYSKKLGLFVIVGYRGLVITSPDGITWTVQISVSQGDTTKTLNAVTYAESLELFVAVGTNGRIITSNDGISWDERTNPSSVELKSVIYSEFYNLFVVGGYNGVILTSSDGIVWTVRNNVGNNILDIFYADEINLFAAIGRDGTWLVSTNGIEWNDESKVVKEDILSVTHSRKQNLYVAIYKLSSQQILLSNDGENWIIKTLNLYMINVRTITYSEELDVFVAGGGSIIYTSSDGINWIETELSIQGTISDIIYSESLHLFVAVGQHLNVSSYTQVGSIFTSPDGINWTYRLTGVSTYTLRSVTYSEPLHLFVAVGNGVLISSDGINWTPYSASFTTTQNSIVYSSSQNLFVSVGENGTIYTSSDGINWIERIGDLVAGKTLKSIVFSKETNLFFAVGVNKRVVTSPDGINWTARSEGTVYDSQDLNDIVLKDDIFLMVGEDGFIMNAKYTESENIIQYLSQDSDMTFKLQIGENQLQLARENGSLFSRINYRQKYIGV